MRKKLKAEVWDRMQFLFRNYYDRMIHLKLSYQGTLDKDALKNAVLYMVENAPVLHSSFHSDVVEPYWKEEKYTIDDILSVTASDDAESAADAFLLGVIPYENNVQIKIALFEEGNKSVLAARVNHMCMDGGDLKYFIATLVENYNNLKRENYSSVHVKTGTRSLDQIYSKFEGEDLKHAKGLYKNIAKFKDKKVEFPFSPPDQLDRNTIVRRDIDPERFSGMHAVAKSMGITVNDAVMAIVVRSLYEICDLDDKDCLTVSCAIDLRKHIVEGGAQGGMTNHTAWLACRTPEKGETIKDTVVNVLRSMKVHKRDKFIGLYSLPLLKLAYTILPQDLAEFAIKKGYDNPLLAVSNIGVLDEKKLTFDGTTLVDGFMTGAVKHKPYFLMSVTTVLGKMTLSTTTHGNEKDVEIVNRFFDIVEKNLGEFIACSKSAQ